MKRRTTRAVVAIGAGLAALFMSVSAASAHTQLIATTPQAGQHLHESPALVSATFDQILLPTGDAMVVTDAEHHFVNVGTAQLDGATISVAVKPKLPNGTYQVAYRVISADGHPVESSFTFTIGTNVVTDAPTVTNVLSGTDPSSSTTWLSFMLLAFAVAVLLVIALLVVRRRSSNVRKPDDSAQ